MELDTKAKKNTIIHKAIVGKKQRTNYKTLDDGLQTFFYLIIRTARRNVSMVVP